MRIVVRDSKYLAAVRPLDVAGYLRARGWSLARHRERVSQTWTKGTAYEVVLPLAQQLDGFAASMADLLRTLERAEDADQQYLLNDIREGASDSVRVSVDGDDSSDGTINVVDGDNLLSSARGMVWAAACSAVRPRAFFARRRPPEANEFLRRVRLAQSEVGSYRVRLLAPIPPVTPTAQANIPGLNTSDHPPFERQATQLLVSGLQAASQAVEGVFALRDSSDIDGLVARGVNGNLCDSLNQLRNLTRVATSISIAVSWSWRRPAQTGLPTQFTFANDLLEAVGELGRVLKDFVPQEEVEIFGSVVKLESDDPAVDGTVVVRAYFEGGVKLVRVRLRQPAYRLAWSAHDSRALITCFGDLIRQGRSYELQNPRAFRIVATGDDASGDGEPF
jgi:hypothetical protein